MDDAITITQMNDFIFCPASIYFHKLYGSRDVMMFQTESQLSGKKAHERIDDSAYSTRKDVLTALDVYSEKYHLIGKIDIYDMRTGTLVERKRQIKHIYDGYVFQVYGQYYALLEMGYTVNKIFLHSLIDNKRYGVPLPYEDAGMQRKFEDTIYEMRHFEMDFFQQTNSEKCRNCIYEPACDRSLL